MSKQVTVRLDEAELAALDEAVAAGRYPTRADALRLGLGLVLAGRAEPDDPADAAADGAGGVADGAGAETGDGASDRIVR